MTPEAKERISRAQKERWAAKRAAKAAEVQAIVEEDQRIPEVDAPEQPANEETIKAIAEEARKKTWDAKYADAVVPAPTSKVELVDNVVDNTASSEQVITPDDIDDIPEVDLNESEKETMRLEIEYLEEQLRNKKQELAWDGKKVTLCLPWYKQTNPMTAIALIAVARKYGEKIGVRWSFGDAIIENARNNIADQFLTTESEYSLWVDDDMIFSFGHANIIREQCHVPASYPEELLAIESVDRLYRSRKTVIGGVYFQRNENGVPTLQPQAEHVYEMCRNPETRQIVEVDWIATGFMMVHRSVFEDIRKKFPELAPGIKEHTIADPNTGEVRVMRHEYKHWGYFNKMDGCGEDLSFCYRARRAGHKVYADLAVRPLHVGYNCWGFHNTRGLRWK